MKAVLPALTGQGYDHLAIREGGTASLEFLRVTFGDVGEEEQRRGSKMEKLTMPVTKKAVNVCQS